MPAFRSMAAGMMLSVGFVLLAALTLLPALLGPWINRLALPWHTVGEHRSPWWARFAQRMQARAAILTVAVVAVLLLLASPLLSLKTGMPSINVLPKDRQARVGYDLLAGASVRAGRGRCRSSCRRASTPNAVAQIVATTPGVAAVFPAQPGGERLQPGHRDRHHGPVEQGFERARGTLRTELPSGVLVGGPVAENHDLDQTLRGRAPIVIGTVLVLGFLLLLFALQADLHRGRRGASSTCCPWAPRSASGRWRSSTAGLRGRWASRARAT